ncbi:MAG: molecular chaperone DnaJ [Phenylobacterium sp.]
MSWILLAAVAAFAVLIWAGRRGDRTGRREWRLIAGGLALAAVVGGTVLALRGAWPAGLVLIFTGLGLAGLARSPGPRPGPAPTAPSPEPDGMSLSEARSVLGVGPDASREEILEAHARLIRRTHPDAGGTDGLAAHLNAARDRLLGP